ncbi:hypothetical protein [Aliarcobacter cibarius]|jgi:hypothetical protein|uniref:Uncharacterized protein n=1 Tax=Aliarcobacter cibarius TaxID=255507 RepID=A0ABY2V5M9_9BACT|nr:hypothetical protein [Aliarcobacter cibarius]QEZ89849.1 putative membrane protein [Aliarcobacter cibarius]TLT00832.1 hypothetical protein FE247_03100 [Aliarcobacter cibarius]TLT01402.1 hypothetical protein FE245_02630 [Aliarcobacter cibarius]
MKTFILANINKLILLFFTLIVLFFASSFTVDESAKKMVDESFKQAIIVFGSAKALNGVISLAQGTEINLPFIVVAIGQILDPINDLVEQFSLIMLASLVSLGIQKILLNFVTNDIFNYILFTFIIIFNIWLFKRFRNDGKLRSIFFKTTFILIFLRFSIPMISYVNDFTYNYFVKPQYNIEHLNKNILKVTDNVSKINQDTIEQKQDESSFFGKIVEKFDLKFYEKKVDEYKNAVDNSSEYIIDLIIVFIFQTILLPIVFIYILYVLIKKMFYNS